MIKGKKTFPSPIFQDPGNLYYSTGSYINTVVLESYRKYKNTYHFPSPQYFLDTNTLLNTRSYLIENGFHGFY
jgi:hypothetical protein